MNIQAILPAALLFGGMFDSPAHAIFDPRGDLLGTFSGPARDDLDILSVDAFALNNEVHFEVITAGRMSKSSGVTYTFGIDRGAGTAGLLVGDPAIGSDVFFDAVFEIRTDGTGTLTAFNDTGSPTVTGRTGIFFFQNSIRAAFDKSLLPSRGLALEDFRYTVWSRKGVGNAGIADLTRSIRFGAVPEPKTWAMMIGGFALAGVHTRARRRVPMLA